MFVCPEIIVVFRGFSKAVVLRLLPKKLRKFPKIRAEVSFEKLKEYAERERLGPLFAQIPQDAHKLLVCPNCATAFLVTNIPRYAEEKDGVG